MATTNTMPTAAKLQDAIREMDEASQNAFGQIAVIARLALASMETPEFYNNAEPMAHANAKAASAWNSFFEPVCGGTTVDFSRVK